jgi:hypothetical protein
LIFLIKSAGKGLIAKPIAAIGKIDGPSIALELGDVIPIAVTTFVKVM